MGRSYYSNKSWNSRPRYSPYSSSSSSKSSSGGSYYSSKSYSTYSSSPSECYYYNGPNGCYRKVCSYAHVDKSEPRSQCSSQQQSQLVATVKHTTEINYYQTSSSTQNYGSSVAKK